MSSSDSSENEHYSDDEKNSPGDYDFFHGAFDIPFFKGKAAASNQPLWKPNQNFDNGQTSQVNIKAKGSVSLFNNTFIHNGAGAHSEDQTKPSKPPRNVNEAILESQEVIEVEHMYKVADLIGLKWQRLALLLPSTPKFTVADLDTIKYDKERDGLVEIIVSVLNKWVERNDEKATIGALASTLQKIDCTDIVNELELIKTDKLL